MGLGKGNSAKTSEIHSLKVSQSLYGIVIPILWGRNRVQQNLIWSGDFQVTAAYQQGGKGLGKSGGTLYDYRSSVLGAACHGPINGIGNIWAQNGRLTLQSVSEAYTVPSGGGSITVANADKFHSDNGVGQQQSYSVIANDFGSPGPTTLTGMQSVALTPTTGTPGTGQYSQNGAGVYTLPASAAGTTVTINYSFSLYTLGATEDYNIPNAGPIEIAVQYQAYFYADQGVFFVDTGLPLESVPSFPGPGQYTCQSGNYFFNVADATRPIAINYLWQQSDSNSDPSAILQFTLIEGSIGQNPWEYLTSRHLSQALGYSGIALIGAPSLDLGPEAMLPNYNFEILGPLQFGAGLADADMALVIQDFLLNPYYGCRYGGLVDDSLTTLCRDYWNSNSFLGSPILDTQQSASETIEKWCEAGNVGVFHSEGRPKFIPYGDTTTIGNGFVYTPQTHPVVDLTDDDFLADEGEDPVQIERTFWEDAYNEVKIQYTNRQNNYNSNSIIEQDDWAIANYGLRPEGQQDYSFLCTAQAAQFAANIRLKRLVNIRKKYSFKISGIRYPYLELMDLVTLTDATLGLNKEPVRITDISEDENRVYSITSEEFPWGTATATLYSKQDAQPPSPSPGQADPMNTTVADIFEPPSRVATTLANSPYQIWCALSGGPNWGGCEVWFSKDGVNYQQIGVQTGPSRAGVITANLPAGADPDITNTLAVRTTGELFNVTKEAADSFVSICKVGTEYLAYQNATLSGSNGLENTYDLTYLRRGIFTTPNILHDATDPTQNTFVRCDNQLFQYSYDPSLAGSTVYFKFPAFNGLGNRQQGLADVSAYAFTLAGTNASKNMKVDSILDGSGMTATIRVYLSGGATTDGGSVTLTNGAVVTLPAHTQSGFETATLYYVNFNPVDASYHFYTDQNDWLLDEIVNGYIKIGSITTASIWSFIPIMGGGNFALSAGTLAPGASIPLPGGGGYSAARSMFYVSPSVGYDGSQQIKGVLDSTVTGLATQSRFAQRGGGATPASTSWAGAAWTDTPGVQVTVVGSQTQISFTTANGDDLCFVFGELDNGMQLSIPAGGFTAANCIGIVGPASTAATGNGMQGVVQCSLDATLHLGFVYTDAPGNHWGGGANSLHCFWKDGGGVSAEAVSGGIALTITLPGSHAVCLVQSTNLQHGHSFGVPAMFTGAGFAVAVGMSGWIGGTGGQVAHGWSVSVTGSAMAATYSDGGGVYTTGFGNVLAISNI